MKIRTLYVPANVGLRNEIWRGLSVADAVRCAVAGISAGGIGTLLHFTLGLEIIWCVLGAAFIVALNGTLLTRFSGGLSMMDYLRIALKYSREQKRFYYVYRRQK